MAVSQEDILETVSSMTVMDVVDLISAMEEKFGVSAAAAVAVAAVPGAGGEAVAEEEQTDRKGGVEGKGGEHGGSRMMRKKKQLLGKVWSTERALCA